MQENGGILVTGCLENRGDALVLDNVMAVSGAC
jgi:hypothetical protein